MNTEIDLFLEHDWLAERLRRWTPNPFSSSGTGSNPTPASRVLIFFVDCIIMIHAFYRKVKCMTIIIQSTKK